MNDRAVDGGDAYAAALADLRTAMAVLHACETSLYSEQRRRMARGVALADLGVLVSARAALAEARELIQPAVDEAEAWLRAHEVAGPLPAPGGHGCDARHGQPIHPL